MLPSVFAINARVGAAGREARLRDLRDLWLDPIVETGRVTLLTNRDPSRSCAITAFRVAGMDSDRLAAELRERHGFVIGSVKLADKPDFTGNDLAANLTDSPEQIERSTAAFKTVIGTG